MKRRILESIKTIVIVVLSLAVLLLAAGACWPEQIAASNALSALFAPVTKLLGFELVQIPPKLETEGAVSDSAKPILISVQTPAGRCSYQMSFSALDPVYEHLGGLLGEALDTAAAPEEITAGQFYAGLRQPGFLFAYSGSIPVELLAAWLDASSAEAGQFSSFALSIQNETVYFLAAGQTYQRCATKLSEQALTQALGSYLPDGSAFAFESSDETYHRLAPMTLLNLSAQPEVYEIVSSNPCDGEMTQRLAASLGFNPFDDSSYLDNRGSTIYNEAECSLRITASGELSLTNHNLTDSRFLAPSTAPETLTEYAKTLISELQKNTLGDARLYLTSYEQAADTVTILFDYIVDGVPVVFSNGPAASVTFENGCLTQLNLRLRAYTRTQTPMTVLPVKQAVAIAAFGSRLRIEYADLGGSSLMAGWVS